MVRQAHHDICHPELVEGWQRGAMGDFLINVYSIMSPLICTYALPGFELLPFPAFVFFIYFFTFTFAYTCFSNVELLTFALSWRMIIFNYDSIEPGL